jgi:hypothetical protein
VGGEIEEKPAKRYVIYVQHHEVVIKERGDVEPLAEGGANARVV